MILNNSKSNVKINVFDYILFVSISLLIVFPNSFREVKLPLLIVSFLYSLKYLSTIKKPVFLYLILGSVVTIIYILVGLNEAKKPEVSTPQVLFVYAVTPVLWASICNMIFVRYRLRFILNSLVVLALVGSLTIFVGIWLFDTGRLDLLEYVIDNPNKTLTATGVIEMKLFVYGSLIFLIPAFLQVAKFYSKTVSGITLLIFIIACIVSGRSALILSLIIGFLAFLLFNKNYKILLYLGGAIIFLLISSYVLTIFNINIENVFLQLSSKVSNTQTDPRQVQMTELLQQMNLLGRGHGVGVSYIRNYLYPWRYEVLPIAILFRVGIIGTFIYALPMLFSFKVFFTLKNKNSLDRFMFIGLLSMILASFSNPYLESFEFNFFYVFPFIYFVRRKK